VGGARAERRKEKERGDRKQRCDQDFRTKVPMAFHHHAGLTPTVLVQVLLLQS
jgi:hypothetical protein